MKIFIAPVIYLMDRLGLKTKLYLIVSISLFPVLVLSYVALEFLGKEIAHLSQERSGLAIERSLQQLLVAVGQSRGSSNSYLNSGKRGDLPDVMEKQQQVEKLITALESMEESSAVDLQLSEKVSAIREAWAVAQAAFRGNKIEASFTAHNQVIELIIAYMKHVGRVTHLLQDSGGDNAHMADVFIRNIPTLINDIGVIRGSTAGLLANPGQLAKKRVKLMILIDRVEYQLVSIANEIAYLHHQPALKTTFAQGSDNVNAFLQTTREQIALVDSGISSKMAVQDYFAQGTQAIQDTLQLSNEMIPIVMNSIEKRITQERLERNIYMAIIAATIVLLAYLLLGFYLSFTRKLRRLVCYAKNMADGDLTQSSVTDLASQDEMGQIFNAMDTISQGVSQTIAAVLRTSSLFNDVSTRLTESSQITENSVSSQVEDSAATSHSITELSSMVQDISSNISEAANSAKQAEASANSGRQVVTEVVESIDLLSGEIGKVSDVINKVNSDSQEISTILNMIGEIAEQTNLLALNAAIEAARAGEHGRGFAVVADEVRNLANKTHLATQDIQRMIDALKSGSNRAVEVIAASEAQLTNSVKQAKIAGDMLNEITETVTSISEMNSRIAISAEQQSNMAKNLDNNVINMTSASRQASAVALGTVEDACIIKALASESQSLIKRFAISDEQLMAASRQADNVLFKWDDSFSVGIPEIDRQHRILVDMINDLSKQAADERSLYLMKRILQGLVDYTVSHFSYEEGMLARQGYEKLDAHKEKHKRLIAQVVDFQSRLDNNEEHIMVDLLDFLNEWLAKHIKGADKRYGAALAAKKARAEAEKVQQSDAGGIDLF